MSISFLSFRLGLGLGLKRLTIFVDANKRRRVGLVSSLTIGMRRLADCEDTGIIPVHRLTDLADSPNRGFGVGDTRVHVGRDWNGRWVEGT